MIFKLTYPNGIKHTFERPSSITKRVTRILEPFRHLALINIRANLLHEHEFLPERLELNGIEWLTVELDYPITKGKKRNFKQDSLFIPMCAEQFFRRIQSDSSSLRSECRRKNAKHCPICHS